MIETIQNALHKAFAILPWTTEVQVIALFQRKKDQNQPRSLHLSMALKVLCTSNFTYSSSNGWFHHFQPNCILMNLYTSWKRIKITKCVQISGWMMLDQRYHEKVLLMTDFCAIIVLECRNISNLWNVWECLDRLNVFAFVFLLDSISLFSQIDVTKEKPYINQNGFSLLI